MAATSAAAVASSFSLKYLSSQTWPNDHHLIKISCTRTILNPTSSLSHSLGTTDQLSPIGSTKWKVLCIAEADVTQETAVEVEEENSGDGVVATATESSEASTKIYFGNLPYLCDSAQLAGIIQEYASPELVEVLYDRDTGKSRGFAFVTMSSIEECNTVIQNLDGREFGGRTLRVNLAAKPKPKEPLYPETEHKLFVGNLSWSVTSEILTEAFQECGNVVGARVLYDGETGRSRGYAFVSYETKAEMEAALVALNGLELEGRAIRVSLAQGKRE